MSPTCDCNFCHGKRPHYVLYVTNEDTNHESVHVIYEHHTAQKLLNYIIGGDPVQIITPNHEHEVFNSPYIKTAQGAVIRCTDMQALIDYQPTLRERGDKANDARLRRDATLVYTERRAPVAPAITGERRSPSGKPRKHRAPRTGMVTAISIAEDIGMKPRDFRAALRKAKVHKPDCGWAWPADQVDKIRALVEGRTQ